MSLARDARWLAAFARWLAEEAEGVTVESDREYEELAWDFMVDNPEDEA